MYDKLPIVADYVLMAMNMLRSTGHAPSLLSPVGTAPFGLRTHWVSP
jgi:hypothetical protein